MTVTGTRKVGLLHTAQAHVPVFDRIVATVDPTATLVHEVQPELLEATIENGITDEVIRGVNRSLAQLVGQGSTAISCTCSTLGELVEDRFIDGVKIQRIDRAVADDLMRFDRVLVLAAIESAAEAADKLLDKSARMADSNTRWLVAIIPGAWPLFEAGKQEAYDHTVADFANQFSDEYDAIFLSQASMLGAAGLCDHVSVFTSPESGMKRLLGM